MQGRSEKIRNKITKYFTLKDKDKFNFDVLSP
jgi:hypothetical protein